MLVGLSLLSANHSRQVVFVKIAALDNSIPSYAKMTDGTDQIILTDRAHADSESLAISVEHGQRLALGEVMTDDASVPHRVLFQKGRIVLLSLPVGEHHVHDQNGMPVTLLHASSSLRHSIPSNLHADDFANPENLDRPISFDPAVLKQRLSQLAGIQPVTVNGEAKTITERGSLGNKALARAFLKEQLTASGFVVSEHNYGSGKNLIAEKTGTDPSKFLVLSAHLDSVHNAGADDDGSGIVSAWSIAEYLANQNPKHTIRFVAFDEEELGLIGSEKYAASLAAKGGFDGFLGDLNIEMTGYDSNQDGAIHIIDCNEGNSGLLTAAVEASIRQQNLPLKKIAACTNRSDHASFWQYDQPAIVVSQNFFGRPADANPCYHRSCDKPDILNFDYMAKITAALAGAAASLVL
jgi:hypothetical protein